MATITHFSTVHPRYDTRVLLKECSSLAQDGHKVNLVIADGKPNENFNGVNIIAISKPFNRLFRATFSQFKMFLKLLTLKSDIYHFHDPELMFTGIVLKIFGKRVVFDIHEDVPGQILSKPYLNRFLLRIISKLYGFLESNMIPFFDHLITVNEDIRGRLLKESNKVEILYNYPILDEFLEVKHDWDNKERAICYVGGITEIRGIESLVKAAKLANAKLIMGGSFNDPVFEQKIKNMPEWENVEYLGQITREQMFKVFERSSLGMITFLPEPNHINATPNKFFEYLSAGLPIATSNFDKWQNFINEYSIGCTFIPGNPEDMANAINTILADREYIKKASEKGKQLCIEKRNWANEYNKLKSLYASLLQ